MAQLAIKGHPTRGSEVIALLEMLEGSNKYLIYSTDCNLLYTIREVDNAIIATYPNSSISQIYTLEEFFAKYPYKVGDKVQHKGATSCGTIYVIEQMKWENNKVKYVICDLYWKNCKCTVTAKDLQPYKEETMEGKLVCNEIMSLKIDQTNLNNSQIIFSADSPDKTELVLGDNFEVQIKDSKTYVVRKQLYPNTFENCLKILGYNIAHTIPMNHGHNGSLIMKFQKLLIYRDAYWKIAGEQMGLGKSWQPDTCQIVYSIGRNSNKISFCNVMFGGYFILEFPTTEMRDAFYENFKDLIETVKELL